MKVLIVLTPMYTGKSTLEADQSPMFVTLTMKVLLALKKSGYTVLTSVSPLSDEDPVWYPETFDVDELMDIYNNKIRLLSIPLEERHFLIIDDAIANIDEDDLIGQVFLEPMFWDSEGKG